MKKSTPEEIRARFDKDVERFSNLETGQSAAVDSPLMLDLIAQAATASTPGATAMLDIGCGAGNLTLKLLERAPQLDVTLIDLSQPMLTRAVQRIGRGRAIQGDIREIPLEEASFDIVVGAAVFHHLRGEDEWRAVFQKIYRSLRPGGSFWSVDLIAHSTPAVSELMRARYAAYLTALKDADYQRHVFEYMDYEDTPRPLLFQVDLLRDIGFAEVDILHKNVCFAAFGAIKH